MDWDDLRYFLAVAEAGSLQGAARALEVNHSTVFRRINRFEKSVGARLFERLADGYQLTAAGEELLAHARRVGEEIDLLQLKVLGKDYRPSGKIRLTAPDSLAYEYLPRYLMSFSNRYPAITLELVVGAESLDLTRREADIAIRATTMPPPHLVGRKVFSLDWAYYASKSYLRRHGRPQRQEGLAQHRIIGADGALGRLPPFRRLQAEREEEIVMTCSTLNAMSAMAVAGYGIALLPDDQIKSTLQRLFPCRPSFRTEVWLLTHPELRRTERMRLLMDHLVESFRAEPRLEGVASIPH
jgi:DNA-binding transcriptional LysR family regulator